MILISDIDNYDNNNYTNIDSYDDNYNADIIYDNNDNVCTVSSGVRNPVILELTGLYSRIVYTLYSRIMSMFVLQDIVYRFVLQDNVQVCTSG